MPARIANLSRPSMDRAAYIRNGTPGPIVELTTVSYLWKIYRKTFKYFINILETWLPVSATGFWLLGGGYRFIVLWIN